MAEKMTKKVAKNTSRKKPPVGLVGDTGAQIQGGFSLDEPLSDLSFPSGLEIYRKMYRNDPVIGGLVQEEIEGLEYGLSNIVDELMSAIIYGFSVGEVLYEVNGFRVILKDIEPRHQLTIQLIDIDTGYIEQSTFKDDYKIPISRCVIHSINSEARNPFGVSLLRWLYKPYFYKTKVEAAEGVSIDRDLGGLPVLMSPEGFDFTAADKGSPNYDPLVEKTLRWAVDLVSRIRKDKQMGVVIPSGWKFELMRSGGTSSFDTDKIIRRFNTEMCVGLLESFLSAGGFSSTNQANVDEMINVFLSACDGLAMSLAETLNRQVVYKWCEYNGISKSNRVRLEPRSVKRVDLADLASFVGRLVKNEVITPTTPLEQALLELADLPNEIPEGENKANGNKAQGNKGVNNA